MKRYIFIAIAAVGAVLLTACGKDRTKTEVDVANVKAAQFTSLPSAAVVLNRDLPEDVAFTVEYSAAQYGYNAAVTYTLQGTIETAPCEDQKYVELGQTTELSMALKTKALNKILYDIGAVVDQENVIKLRILSSIGISKYDTLSTVGTVVVTPFDPSQIYPTLWIVGGYSNWEFASNLFMIYSLKKDDVYQGWVRLLQADLPEGDATGYKFATRADDQALLYGGSMDALSFAPEALPLEAANGKTYLMQADLNTMKAAINNSITRVGIIGSATPNEWNSPDTELVYDAQSQTFRAEVSLTEGGEFKFRANDTWGVCDWGAGPAHGELGLTGGGDNIKFTMATGTYLVIVDLFKPVVTYSFTKLN